MKYKVLRCILLLLVNVNECKMFYVVKIAFNFTFNSLNSMDSRKRIFLQTLIKTATSCHFLCLTFLLLKCVLQHFADFNFFNFYQFGFVTWYQNTCLIFVLYCLTIEHNSIRLKIAVFNVPRPLQKCLYIVRRFKSRRRYTGICALRESQVNFT